MFDSTVRDYSVFNFSMGIHGTAYTAFPFGIKLGHKVSGATLVQSNCDEDPQLLLVLKTTPKPGPNEDTFAKYFGFRITENLIEYSEGDEKYQELLKSSSLAREREDEIRELFIKFRNKLLS